MPGTCSTHFNLNGIHVKESKGNPQLPRTILLSPLSVHFKSPGALRGHSFTWHSSNALRIYLMRDYIIKTASAIKSTATTVHWETTTLCQALDQFPPINLPNMWCSPSQIRTLKPHGHRVAISELQVRAAPRASAQSQSSLDHAENEFRLPA